ncbi:MAG TPA: hypothetical protein VM282_04080 [Acidimicrobiales bacterium]|nr:hypothetical protein [Acidimicrobiales bacterium]
MSSLTPSERAIRARIAAHVRLASSDPVEMTEAARKAGPGRIEYWERAVDPDGVLDLSERLRRAEHAKKAHFSRLAFKSAKVRGRAKAGGS